jgi:DNA-binding transcriptional LysR family regulator
VEAGLGATAISASVAAPSIEAELLQQVAFHLPEREFYVLRHRERYRSRAAETLLALVVRSPAAGGIG